MDAAYPRIAERLFGSVHFIEPFAFRNILEGAVAKRILNGEVSRPTKKVKENRSRQRLSALVEASPVSVGEVGAYGLTDDGVAIVPVCGVLSRRFDWMTAFCGWTTYEGLAATFTAMLADDRVRAILMDVDSPGGEAAGMLDISDQIIEARSVKPVWAVANTCAASAAYGIAGSASKLYLPRLAEVGSIGAMKVHVDTSKADAMEGNTYTAIYSGARKVDGWAHAPIEGEALEAAQADVDYARAQFAALIGRQGRMSTEQALATEAGMFSDSQAVAAGLADGVATFEQALGELSDIAAGRPRSSGFARAAAIITTEISSMTTQTEAAAATEEPKVEAVETEAAAEVAAAVEVAAEAPVIEAAKPADEEKDDEKKPMKGKANGKMPKDEDDDKKDDDKEYSLAVMQTVALAGGDLKEAMAFIAEKAPLAAIREKLLDKRASKTEGEHITSQHAAKSDQAKAEAAAGWSTAVGRVNAQIGGPAMKAEAGGWDAALARVQG